MAGWLPPGQAGDPLKWQLDLQKGWLPPGQIGNPSGVQYEMDLDFDPSQRDAGYQFLHSPPGVAAPEHAINWTPGPGRGEIHGPGVRAPIDKPNISVLPVGATTTDWRRQLPQGGVGSGQAGGGIDPDEDWRRSALLTDTGGLYVGAGQDPSETGMTEDEIQRAAAARLGGAGVVGKVEHRTWWDPKTGVHWAQEVTYNPQSPEGFDAITKPYETGRAPASSDEVFTVTSTHADGSQYIQRRRSSDGLPVDPQQRWEQVKESTPEKPALVSVGNGQFVWVDPQTQKVSAPLQLGAGTPTKPTDGQEVPGPDGKALGVWSGGQFIGYPVSGQKPTDGSVVKDPRTEKPLAIWSGGSLVSLPAEKGAEGATVNDPRTNKPLAVWANGSLVTLPAEKPDDRIVNDPLTGKPQGQTISGTYVPAPAAHEKPLVSTTDAGTGQPIVYDPNTKETTPIGSPARQKPIQMGNRLIRENPQTGAYEEVYKAPTTNTLVHVGNRLLSVNPETGQSQEIASSPEPIRQMGNGIFLVPAGQTLKITGGKGGDRMVSGGPPGGWASQGQQQGAASTAPSSDPTKASTAPSPSSPSTGGTSSTPTQASASSPSSPSSPSTPSSSTASASRSSGPQGLSLYGTESPRTQQDFLAAVGGDRAKAEEMWSRQHQGEIDTIVKSGRDPMTTRLSDLGPTAAAAAAAPARVEPSNAELDAAVRQMTGRNRQDVAWQQLPNTPGTTPDPTRPGPNNPPPWIPPPVVMPQPTVGWGQGAPPQPPGGGVAAGPETGWQPPLDPSQVVGGGNKFGDQVSMEGTHMGTDLQAFKGTPAMSPVDGQVVAVKDEPSGLGLQVSIRDASGQIHTLAHLDNASVRQGDQVQMGQNVAAVGESGAGATGPHLDYRIAGPDGTPVNPEPRMGQLAQLPPHPNTVGEGQAKKGWTPPVGKGQTLDTSIFQQQMDAQAEQFKAGLAVQKQGLENQMAIAKMQHEVDLQNAATAEDQERENERYNYVSQQLQRQFKFIDAQISYAQMANSQNIVKLQIAGQLTQTGMNNQTAIRVADLQTAASLAGTQMTTENAFRIATMETGSREAIAELQARTQLQTQGTFGQRTTADLMKTALTNPWLQQLSGMAPGYGAPGGPGASGGGGNGGILQPLLQGWNAEVPNGEVGAWGGGFDIGGSLASGGGASGGQQSSFVDWQPLAKEQLQRSEQVRPYTDWLNPDQLDPITAKSLYPKGLNIGFPRTTKQGLEQPAHFGDGQAQEGWEPPVGSGQGVGDQLAGGSSDAATWGPYATTGASTAGWGGNAPIATAPPLPTWQQWQAMSPFEHASYRSLVEMAEPWALGVQKLRLKWGAEGGPTAAPGTTQLGGMTRSPLERMGVSQNAEVFGEDPAQYWQNQQKEWSKADQSSAPQLIT